jgi:Holliday junction resolvase
MTGGKSPRRKGNVAEYELRNLLRSHGIPARRVPQSGSSPDSPGDLLVEVSYVIAQGERGTVRVKSEEIFEVKRRSNGFKQIDRWLDDAFAVCYRRDRGEWIITLRLADWIGK